MADGLSIPHISGERKGNAWKRLEQRVELATCVHTVNRDDSRTSVDID